MDKKSNPCFLAYIIFLCVCLVYQLICKAVPKLSFDYWNRIMIAVTISSCFFSISDAIKTIYDMASYAIERTCKLTEQQNISDIKTKEILEKTVNEVKVACEEYGVTVELNDIEQMVRDYEITEKKKSEDYGLGKIEKSLENRAFYITCVGFLAFLIVLVFDSVCGVCLKVQDVLTLLVFIIILASGYAKEIVINYIDGKEQEIKENIIEASNAQEIIKREIKELQRLKEEMRRKKALGEEEQ